MGRYRELDLRAHLGEVALLGLVLLPLYLYLTLELRRLAEQVT